MLGNVTPHPVVSRNSDFDNTLTDRHSDASDEIGSRRGTAPSNLSKVGRPYGF
jgi:hypothetical protein